MTRYIEKNRTRSKTVGFRLTPEEYRQLEYRIKIAGLLKNEFMVRCVLDQPICIRIGKFESDRLSVEIKQLKEALQKVVVSDDAIHLLLECRSLLEQVILITNGASKEKSEHDE